MDEIEVIHHPDQSRFEATVDGLVSVLDYRRDGGVITMTHTGVPPQLRGRGVAGKLTAAALDYARANGLKVVPACSYVAAYVDRHPEYGDLVHRSD